MRRTIIINLNHHRCLHTIFNRSTADIATVLTIAYTVPLSSYRTHKSASDPVQSHNDDHGSIPIFRLGDTPRAWSRLHNRLRLQL